MNRDQLLEVVGEQYSRLTQYQHRIKELERLVFGSKSERFVPEVASGQTTIDFGATEPEKEEPATETITYEREKTGNKSKPSRQSIPHIWKE